MSVFNLNTVEQLEPVNGFRVRFVHTDKVTIAYWTIKKGSVLPMHQHIHEQTSHITRGTFELTIEDKQYTLKPGMVATIASNQLHGGKAITDCEMTDVFVPVREDYRSY